MLQVKGWGTLIGEAGGSCGSSSQGVSYGACPRGITPALVTSFIIGLPSVPAAIALLFMKGWAQGTRSWVTGWPTARGSGWCAHPTRSRRGPQRQRPRLRRRVRPRVLAGGSRRRDEHAALARLLHPAILQTDESGLYAFSGDYLVVKLRMAAASVSRRSPPSRPRRFPARRRRGQRSPAVRAFRPGLIVAARAASATNSPSQWTSGRAVLAAACHEATTCPMTSAWSPTGEQLVSASCSQARTSSSTGRPRSSTVPARTGAELRRIPAAEEAREVRLAVGEQVDHDIARCLDRCPR